MPLLEFTKAGIYCSEGDFYIDPWRKVSKAIITHGHADHARTGMGYYLAHTDSEPVMRLRLGKDINLETIRYGQKTTINGVSVSLHPAGHIIGSAQVRVEYNGEVWVVSGDYKLEDDGLSTPFEPVPCHSFITEATFGLPIYRWPHQSEVMEDFHRWWRQNQSEGRVSVLSAYSLGKAQRINHLLDPDAGPVYVHSSVYQVNQAFEAHGIRIGKYHLLDKNTTRADLEGALVIMPPSADTGKWLSRFEPLSMAFASGWMRIRGARRRQVADRGFVMSDHADWPSLIEAVRASQAENVYVTHGQNAIFSRYLQEKGLNAKEVETLFEGDRGDEAEGVAA